MDNAASSVTGDQLMDGGTPALRLFALLEIIARKDRLFSLQNLVDELGLPKPTLHRMLQQLEAAGMVARDGDRRLYGSGVRLRRMAENLLINNTVHGARRQVLHQLVREVGETSGVVTCVGHEVLCLDRVDTTAPLRFHLQPGSRLPIHCTAAGKLFLAQMTSLQRHRLLGYTVLSRYTGKTLITSEQLDVEIERVRRDGYAIDDEEFLPGLVCIGVLVPSSNGGKSNLAVVIQAPAMRITPEKSLQCLPSLQRAALSLAALETINGEH